MFTNITPIPSVKIFIGNANTFNNGLSSVLNSANTISPPINI